MYRTPWYSENSTGSFQFHSGGGPITVIRENVLDSNYKSAFLNHGPQVVSHVKQTVEEVINMTLSRELFLCEDFRGEVIGN